MQLYMNSRLYTHCISPPPHVFGQKRKRTRGDDLIKKGEMQPGTFYTSHTTVSSPFHIVTLYIYCSDLFLCLYNAFLLNISIRIHFRMVVSLLLWPAAATDKPISPTPSLVVKKEKSRVLNIEFPVYHVMGFLNFFQRQQSLGYYIHTSNIVDQHKSAYYYHKCPVHSDEIISPFLCLFNPTFLRWT